MNRSVSHRSLLACAVVGIGLSIVSCGPTRFAGNITSVVETPDAAADETVDVLGVGRRQLVHDWKAYLKDKASN